RYDRRRAASRPAPDLVWPARRSAAGHPPAPHHGRGLELAEAATGAPPPVVRLPPFGQRAERAGITVRPVAYYGRQRLLCPRGSGGEAGISPCRSTRCRSSDGREASRTGSTFTWAPECVSGGRCSV